jgi:hypothetical protein
MYWDRSTPGFGVRVSGTTTDIGYVAQADLPLPGKKKLTRRVTVGV